MWKEAKLDRLRELAAARIHYEERYGWRVTMEVEPGRLVLTVGQDVGAVAMPREQGALVLADLRIALLAGTVLAVRAGRWWLFLTRPPDRTTPKHLTELRCLDVHLLPSGSRVVVPCEFEATTACPWIEQPRRPAQLPPWPAVLAVTRRVAADRPGLRQPTEPAAPDAATPVRTEPLPANQNDVFRRIA
jgi:hypothetical protein